MNELIRYLVDNLCLDFQGDMDVDKVRDLLRADDSPESRKLLAKLVTGGSADELLMLLVDVLKEHLRTGITDAVMRDQLRAYAES